MSWLLRPRAVFDGERLHEAWAIRIEGDRIAQAGPAAAMPDLPPAPGLRGSVAELIAAPAYVDLQVNGGGGMLLNNTPTAEAMRAIAAAHRACGTGAILPTLISDRPEAMVAAATAIRSACGRDGVAGVHFEGPHLAPARRGTHRADVLRPLDDRTLDLVTGLARAGIPVMLTLAPEMTAPGQIARLAEGGVVVSLGHTAARPDQVRAAIAEGARAATHLYNAMDPMGSRAPGALGAIIDSDLTAGIIADGHHVDPLMIRIAWRARPRPGRMMVVSDAMPTVNGPDRFRLYDEEIRLEGGRLVNAEGALAGVHADMAACVAMLVGAAGLPLAEVLAAATAIPAQLMRLPGGIGRIVPGAPADLVLVDAAGRLCGTVMAGRPG